MLRMLLFLFILAGLSTLTVLGVVLAVYCFHVDSAPWTHVTSWKSPPVLAGVAVLLCSVVCTAVVSALTSVVGKLMATEQKPRVRPSRPQSNRRTTV